MKPKKKFNSTLILLIILIILGAGYYGWQYINQRSIEEENNLVFGSLDTLLITKIEITSPESTAILEKQNEQWLVASQNYLPADQTAINNILSSLTQIKIKELISTNTVKQPDYQVDAAAINVKLYQSENLLADFYPGKYGPLPASGFFRWQGSDNVYLVSENLQSLFYRADWADATAAEEAEENSQ
ncbi:DUF4340 domain-containing protein [Patescibacteria group bacterium]|nr:DUF4340 domain-containing protein [Patescibacteria group bacterium]